MLRDWPFVFSPFLGRTRQRPLWRVNRSITLPGNNESSPKPVLRITIWLLTALCCSVRMCTPSGVQLTFYAHHHGGKLVGQNDVSESYNYNSMIREAGKYGNSVVNSSLRLSEGKSHVIITVMKHCRKLNIFNLGWIALGGHHKKTCCASNSVLFTIAALAGPLPGLNNHDTCSRPRVPSRG